MAADRAFDDNLRRPPDRRGDPRRMTDGRCARLSWFEPQLDETTDQHPARARCGRSLRRPGRRCDGNRTLTAGIPGEDPARTGRAGGRGKISPPAATTCPPADLRIRRGVSFWGSDRRFRRRRTPLAPGSPPGIARFEVVRRKCALEVSDPPRSCVIRMPCRSRPGTLDRTTPRPFRGRIGADGMLRRRRGKSPPRAGIRPPRPSGRGGLPFL